VRSGPTSQRCRLNPLGHDHRIVDPDERLVALSQPDVVFFVFFLWPGRAGDKTSRAYVSRSGFGDRVWFYQAVDLRTEVWQIGEDVRHQVRLLHVVRTKRKGEDAEGHHTGVPQLATNTGIVAPRIFQDDTPEDKRAARRRLRKV